MAFVLTVVKNLVLHLMAERCDVNKALLTLIDYVFMLSFDSQNQQLPFDTVDLLKMVGTLA